MNVSRYAAIDQSACVRFMSLRRARDATVIDRDGLGLGVEVWSGDSSKTKEPSGYVKRRAGAILSVTNW